MSTDASWSGSMPEVYDRALSSALFAPWARLMADRAAGLAPRRVLEVAAGSGIVTAELVRRLPAADITATDLNPGMVSWGESRVPRAHWQFADAQQLPFADGSFDLVVCQFGVMFFPDKVAALREAARVLLPGGRVLMATWDSAAASPFPAALVESMHDVMPDDPPTFVERVPHGYHDVELMVADFTAAGLRPDPPERLVLTGSSPSAVTVAEGYCQGTPLRFSLEERGDLATLTQQIAAGMTRRLGTGRVEGGLAAYLISAVKD